MTDKIPNHYTMDGNSLNSINVSTQIASYAPILGYLSTLAEGASLAYQQGAQVDDLLVHLNSLNQRLAAAGVNQISNFGNLTSHDMTQFQDTITFAMTTTQHIIKYVADIGNFDASQGQKITQMILNTYALNHSLDYLAPVMKTVMVLAGVSVLAAFVPEVAVALVANSGIEAVTGYDVVGNIARGNFNPNEWQQDDYKYRLFNAAIAILGVKGGFDGLDASGKERLAENLAEAHGIDKATALEMLEDAAKEGNMSKSIIKMTNVIEEYVDDPLKALTTASTVNQSMQKLNANNQYVYHPIPQGAVQTTKIQRLCKT